jgi:putative transposase
MKLLDAQLAAGVLVNAAQFAREHGVSVRTVYRHQARTRAEGEWRPRSRRPRTSPRATPPDLAAWICKLRAELGIDNGADHILDALRDIHARTNPPWRVPSRSTVNRVLGRHDLLERNPAKRPRCSFRRFAYARPRDCYQIDATEVKLADGSAAAIFDVLDDCTRLLVACHVTAAETARGAVEAITKAVRAHGAPALVLSDNGVAFTTRFTNPRADSSFVRALHQHGIRPINSSPFHPQTCGKVERHHQTLKKWLSTRSTPKTIKELQHLLDAYRRYYNTQRRHSALPRRSTPQQAWDSAASLGGPSNLPIQVDARLYRCTVRENGHIDIGRQPTSVGRARAGTTVTAVRDGDRATVYDDSGQPIGWLDLDHTRKYKSLNLAQDQT